MENRLIRFSAGDKLFTAGEQSRNMYIIRSGTVKVLIEKDRKLIPLIELGKGQYVGEMSFLTGVKRSATVIAETSVLVSDIPPEILDDENLGLSSWAVSIARVLVQRIRSTTELLGDYLLSNVNPDDPAGRRAEDLRSLEIKTLDNIKQGRLYLKGQFSESSIEMLKAKIRELKLKNISPLVLDFSDVIDIDQAGINFIFNLTQSSAVSDEKILIENMQLIRDKVLSIKGLQKILATSHVPLRRVDKDELLIKQGDLEHMMYVVKNGSFTISRKTESGSIALAKAESGDVIGEMSLIKEGSRSADVRADKPGVVHVIDVREFYNNIYNIPGWFMELIRGLVQRLRNTNEMIEQLGKKQEKTEPEKKWSSPFGVVLDSTRPGKFIISGVMTLPNLQYLVQLLKLEMKKNTPEIVLDLSKVKSMEKECAPALLSIYTRMKARNIDVKIRGPKKGLLYLFKHQLENED